MFVYSLTSFQFIVCKLTSLFLTFTHYCLLVTKLRRLHFCDVILIVKYILKMNRIRGKYFPLILTILEEYEGKDKHWDGNHYISYRLNKLT